MKIVLILPYFGKFPNYFNLHLNTIKSNKNIHWLFITNDKTNYFYPENVTLIYKNFQEVQEQFQSNFNFKISLETPFKLCDFRPAFGLIFQEYIKEYDFWGHCDPDILWGKFDNFIFNNVINNYDKVFTFGHLTLYKNDDKNNLRFLEKINNQERYKTVFSHPIGFAFDEKFNNSINTIFKNNNYPMLLQNVAADVDSYHTNFRLSIYNYQTNNYYFDGIKKQLFTLENGSIYRYIFNNNTIEKQEFLYIHLQKRAMIENFKNDFPNKILISQNEFLPLNEEITIANFDKYYKPKWYNKQFLKVKWNSFKYKLKHKSYFYGSNKNL